jgi:hypothetical protein
MRVGVRACRALGDALVRTCPTAERDSRGYAVRLEDNLLAGITRGQIEKAFAAGAGRELDDKMRAPWSSSALAVNAFAPWQSHLQRLRLGGLSGFSGTLVFEARCPNGVSSIPPHLDVLLTRDREVVGVESKCTEFLTAKRKVAVSPGYLALAARGDQRASSRWFGALAHVSEFRLLDAYQLIKHYLGLTLEYQERPRKLVYLYWEPANAEEIPIFAQHRNETDRFTELVAGDPSCAFTALSYPEHWLELETIPDAPDWLHSHLTQLRDKYLIEI